MEGHVRTVASLHIALSILGFLLSIVIYSVLNLIGNFVDDKEAEFVLSIVANVVAILLFVLAIPGLIGGIGLFNHKEWARILVLIVSALKLLNFPIGTAVGVYSIWVLVQRETTELFSSGNIQNTNS